MAADLEWVVSVDSVLITALGFVVALSLSFRSATAYERYAEGRKYVGLCLGIVCWWMVELTRGGI